MHNIFDRGSIKILTTQPGRVASKTWEELAISLPRPRNNFLSSLRLALRLYMRRLDFDCVVVGSGRTDILFCFIQATLPSRRVPCVMIDCLWYKKKNPIAHLLKKLTFRIVDKKVARYAVWASREIDAYSEAFGLPKKKFVFVPYHTTALDIKPTAGNYIFSGGNFDRDYGTLIRAVEGLPIKLFIGCSRPEAFSKISIPGNVDVRGYSHTDYMEKMAGCQISVVSMAPGILHSGGQQTFLNSMWYGKPTIVNDPEGAIDYIRHGEDGMLVKPSDPSSLRKAILWLLDHPEEAKKMGAKAMRKARTYSTEEHFKKIVSIVKEVVENSKPWVRTG